MSAREHLVGVLVGEDRGDDRVVARSGRRGQQVADPGEVVRAVPDLERLLARGARAGPGPRTRLGRARDRPARPRKRLGRGDARARGSSRATTSTRAAPAARAAASHSGSPSTTIAPGRDDRELLGRDRLARLAEHVGVLERDVRQHDDPRVEDVRRVEPAAEPGLDDGDVDLARGELGERGGGEHLELRRARRRAAGRARAPLEIGVARRRPGSAPPSRARAARCTRRRAAPRRASSAAVISVVEVLPFVPTTWIAG